MGNRYKNKLIALAFTAIALATPIRALAECAPETVTILGQAGKTVFQIEVADTPEKSARGLMFRETLADDAGMLFFFDPPRRVSFWMRNTLIPLDMIFIDARGVVRQIHENAIPHDETGIASDGPVRAVLEINGGYARSLGIKEGALVQHSGIDQSRAALPCPTN